jgi:hypothetical protein
MRRRGRARWHESPSSWALSKSLRTDLALDALEMGAWTRHREGHDVTGVTHHSDEGVRRSQRPRRALGCNPKGDLASSASGAAACTPGRAGDDGAAGGGRQPARSSSLPRFGPSDVDARRDNGERAGGHHRACGRQGAKS